mgnify:CR=1 FL=1
MWATIFSLLLLAALFLFGYTAIWPYLYNEFLPDGSHKDAVIGRYILMGSYLFIVTVFCLLMMRPTLINLINSSAGGGP